MLSREAKLVLASAARDDDARLAASLGGALDWGKVLWLAEHERATSVLWHRLSAIGLKHVPDAAAEQMQRIAMVTDFRMLYMRQRLAETLHRLAHEGIDAMLLKGAALAEAVYGSFTARPMSDLDVLVPSDRAQEARDSLLGAGWAGEVDDRMARIYEHHHHLPPLEDVSGTEAKLELHTSLFLEGHPFMLTAERVWERRQGFDLSGVRAYVPSLSDMLLHACLHFAWSNQLRSGTWRTLRDVDHIVTRPDMDWPGFIALARESKAGTLCYWTFRLAAGLVGARIPEEAMEALSPGLPAPILARLARHYVHQALPTEWVCPSERVGRWMWSAGMRPKRSGYGTGRPWRHDDRIPLPGYEKPGATGKVTSHLRQLPRWGRYLRLLIQPAQ